MTIETIKSTNGLRWNNGILEQAWQAIETGRIEWKPIPGEPPQPTTEQRIAALEEQVAQIRGFLNI